MGVRLCQSAARNVFPCYWAVMVPVAIFCLASYEIASWLPVLALWWAKPWLDRIVLFVLSRAAFGQQTTLRDLWDAQRQVLWHQLVTTWTIRRLSPWRSFTQPVYQLEGQSGRALHKRVVQIRRNHSGVAALMTSAFSSFEQVLTIATLSLAVWLAPQGHEPDFLGFLDGRGSSGADLYIAIAYAVVIALLEPFYVGAGFAMYLNRRVELEAWDIEQELRRAFSH